MRLLPLLLLGPLLVTSQQTENLTGLPDWHAWITPILNVSDECFRASMNYIENSTTFLQVLDSDGRLPLEGFLSDSFSIPIPLCDIVNIPSCKLLPPSLTTVVLKLPIGFSKSPGRMENCLNLVDSGFNSKYCSVDMKPPAEMAAGGGGPFGRNARAEVPTYFARIAAAVEQVDQWRRLKGSAADLTARGYKQISGQAEFQAHVEHLFTLAPGDDPKPLPLPNSQIIGMFMGIYAATNLPNIGMCFPAECSTEDINGNYALVMERFNSYGAAPENSTRFTTTEDFCFTKDNKTNAKEPTDPLNMVIYTVLGCIGLFMLLGTLAELLPLLSSTTSSPLDGGGMTPDVLGMQLLKSFSLYSNGTALLSTKQGGGGRLDCMNGMRFLSMTWVVMGHSLIGVFSVKTRNEFWAFEVLAGDAGIAFEALLNALPSVDSFFIMGGTLTAYIMARELEKAGSNTLRHIVTCILYYVHRYLRLTIPYALIMGVVIAVLPHLAYGPSWSMVNFGSEACRTRGWENMLYINNLVDRGLGNDNNCMGVTWYLVDDMIFHIISLPLIFYPMYLLKKWKGHTASVAYWTLLTSAVTAFVFGLNYHFKNLPSEFFTDVGFGRSKWTYHVSLYFAPWNRYQPYLIGALLGYILHHTRGQKLKLDLVVNLLFWQASFLAAFAVVYGLYDIRTSQQTTLFMSTAYNAFQRLAWSMALGWVIFSCVKGYGGIVNNFLSWSFWAPLSRLTYSCYLIHMEVITMLVASTLSFFPSDATHLSCLMYFLGTLSISLAAAAIFVLAFEFPFTRVEKLLIGKLIGALMGDPKTGGQQPIQQNTGKQSPPALNITKQEESEMEIVKSDETSGTEDSGQGSQKSHSSIE